MIHGHSGIEVFGIEVRANTCCAHYHTDRDIIAIRFKCCDRYYPCHTCHEETAGHKAIRWPKADLEAKAILCGACGRELRISEYLACEATCPSCNAAFNPNCALHYSLYFEFEVGTDSSVQ